MPAEVPHNEAAKNAAKRVRFGVFEADLESGELRRSGVRVRLQSQPFKLLAALLEQPGVMISREILHHQLWDNGTIVDFDHSLGIAVNKLREALGDSAENPRFVETLAKRGYRFIAPVHSLETIGSEATRRQASESDTSPDQIAAPRRNGSIQRWKWASFALAGLSSLLGLTLVLRPVSHKPYQIAQITFSGQVEDNQTEVGSFSNSVDDGKRLYFSLIENGTPALAVALTANGEISRFNLPSEIGSPLIGSISPDGSKLIVHGHLQASPEQPLWIVPTLGSDVRKVPNVLAHDATWMPDGNRLLIANGNNLTVVNADGSDAHTLLTVPGLAFWLRWSPDGLRLRYTLRLPERQTSELWEVAADGSHPHPLLPGWNQPASECCGSWTSDGAEFVFESRRKNHSQIWSLRESPWLLKDRLPRQITDGPLDFKAPSSTPGSHSIHFIGVSEQYHLLQAVPHSTAFTTLNPSLNSASLVSFSGDGAWVAWLNTSDGSLWRSRVDGSERIELTTQPFRIFSMKWSPDDKRLALMGEEPGKPWKLYLIDSDGGKLTPLVNENRNEADPNWSADGNTLVFGRLPDRMDSEQKPKCIYLLDMNTRQVSEVPGSTGLFSPRLSPDGRSIAAMRLDQHALLLYDRSAQHWTTLTTHGVGDPFWSRDGKFIYFQDFLEPGKPIYRIAITSRETIRVASIADLRPITATDYRLIGLAPGDLPIVSSHTSTVNLYSVDLKER